MPGHPSHSTFHQTTVIPTLPRANGAWDFRVQGSEDSLLANISLRLKKGNIDEEDAAGCEVDPLHSGV